VVLEGPLEEVGDHADVETVMEVAGPWVHLYL
jgi:hypothetical protein